ncbi:MAG: YeeE/YedE family protein [Pseudomonadota bacterium]
MRNSIEHAFWGGILIGLSALFMLLFNGRIMGISGILGGFFNPSSRRQLWRYFFFAGILWGGILLKIFLPHSLDNTLSRNDIQLVLAGILVGWGTRLGNGCTSGHGICGVSRLSPRSLVATGVFMLFGILTVWIMHFWGLTS